MQGESACADSTLIYQITPRTHLRLLRSDCKGSRQRATVHMLSQQTPTLTSKHTRVACRVQTTPSYTKLSRHNTSIHAEGTAFAVDNEQHHTRRTPPSMVHLQQDSLFPTSGNPRAACRPDCTLENQHKPLRLFHLLRCVCHCSHQRETANPVRNPTSRFEEKEVLQVKSIQGGAQAEKLESLPGKTSTGARQDDTLGKRKSCLQKVRIIQG